MTSDTDPNGLGQHAPGAKLDSGKNMLGLVLGSFSRAVRLVGLVGSYGARKYSKRGWEAVSEGEERYTDALFRHLFDYLGGEENDPESGLPHLAHAAWNALAITELSDRRKANGTAATVHRDRIEPAAVHLLRAQVPAGGSGGKALEFDHHLDAGVPGTHARDDLTEGYSA